MRGAGENWKPFSFGRVELEDDKYSFVPLVGREVEITAYRGHENILVIPDTMSHVFQVTRIGQYAFKDRDISRMIFVPENVTYIGEGAFSGCSMAEAIELPESVTYIGCKAFAGCERIRRMEIPGTVTHIGNDAYEGCKDICLIVCEGSQAAEYAAENHIHHHLLCGDFEYMILDDGTTVILDCHSEKEENYIPESICGHRVSAVEKKVFRGFYTLRVIMPENVTVVEINE